MGSDSSTIKIPRNNTDADMLEQIISPEFLRTQQGKEWLGNTEGKKWLASHKSVKWLLTQEGADWFMLASKDLRDLCDRHIVDVLILDSNVTHTTLSYNIFSMSNYLSKNHWIYTREGLMFLTSTQGGRWLRNNDYKPILRVQDWINSGLGDEFLNSDNGKSFILWFEIWKDSNEGMLWIGAGNNSAARKIINILKNKHG